MAMFPVLDFESVSQVDDKQRLDVSGSYASGEAFLTSWEIEPEAGHGYVDVSSAKYLDWQYDAAGDKVVSVRVDNGTGPEVKTFTVSVLSEADDALFSNDELMKAWEPDILKYLPSGKSSYKFQHRRSQAMIIDEINRRGFKDENHDAYTKEDLLAVLEVQEWSLFLTLGVIMEGLSNASDDMFSEKARRYFKRAEEASKRSYLTLDRDGSGDASDAEALSPFSEIRIKRR